MQNTIEHTKEEIQEIERHKYFLSEKAGFDVGWEYAVEDWNSTHAVEFRRLHAGDAVSGKGISMLFRRLFSRSREQSA